jgi:hypothetical protein
VQTHRSKTFKLSTDPFFVEMDFTRFNGRVHGRTYAAC